MKVLFFTNDLLGKNGWSRFSLDVVSGLNSFGVDTICLVVENIIDVNIRQIKILREPLKYFSFPLRLVFDFFKIRKIIKKEKPNIIHFLVEPYLLFLPLIWNPKIKYILTVQGTYAVFFSGKWKLKNKSFSWKNMVLSFFHMILRGWVKICLKKVDQIISGSEYTRGVLLECFPDLGNKTITISNGISLVGGCICYPKNKKKNIVFLGAITERKGLLESIKVAKEYKERYDDNFLFNIIGSFQVDSKYYKNLVEFIQNNDLVENVKFIGRVDEETKNNFLKNADLFIMLSKILDNGNFEGFGLVYLEANKYGVPTIGPNVGGPREAISDGFSGFQVDVFDSVEVAKKIDLILNKKIIKRENCFSWANKNDIILRINKILEIYERQ